MRLDVRTSEPSSIKTIFRFELYTFSKIFFHIQSQSRVEIPKDQSMFLTTPERMIDLSSPVKIKANGRSKINSYEYLGTVGSVS